MNFSQYFFHIANFIPFFIQVVDLGILIFATGLDLHESASDFTICIFPDTLLEFVYVSKQQSCGLDFTKIWDVFQKVCPPPKLDHHE